MTDQLHDALVAANPVPVAEVPPSLRADALAAIHAEVAARSGHTGVGAKPRRAHRRRIFPLGLFAALLITSGAVAAAFAIHAGRPAPKTIGVGSPVRGPGTPIEGSTRLLTLRAPDPAGGLPWGIRTYKTGRGAQCWQTGRVLDGQLGLIGIDSSSHDDGLFHALPVQNEQCRTLDGAGHLFAYQEDDVMASGERALLSCTSFPIDAPKLPLCPAGDHRELFYGFLGPQARSVSVNGGPPRRVDPAEGSAFMVVIKQNVRGTQRAPRFVATYADGTTLPVADVEPISNGIDDPPRGTTPPGYVPPELKLPAPSRVRAAVEVGSIRFGKNVVYRVQFRAPVSASTYEVEYTVLLNAPAKGEGPSHRCGTQPVRDQGVGGPQDNVRAGTRVTILISPATMWRWNRGWCPGTYRGRVIFHDRAHTVGTFAFTVPR